MVSHWLMNGHSRCNVCVVILILFLRGFTILSLDFWQFYHGSLIAGRASKGGEGRREVTTRDPTSSCRGKYRDTSAVRTPSW